ncbi:MAG: RNA binding protein, heterogenous nuclear RNP-K like protein [Chaenotheca gracillima]|nr:MAG: RNA binding protein, heterogenous nuclear RNP-K like protein [Chaenotheca gracillima]
MARQKQATPLKRGPSSELIERATSPGMIRRASRNPDAQASFDPIPFSPNGQAKELSASASPNAAAQTTSTSPGLTELVICIGGIYASFLSWALLQERITTTSYGSASAPEKFRFPVFLNTIQSAFAFLVGYAYLRITSPSGQASIPPIFPTRAILPPLALVAITSSLASPFGYASLAHIDYITFILAKSCKLLPVMALHLTIFRKRYPLYKYAVVAAVTAGVAVFTLHHPTSSKKSSSSTNGGNSTWGLLLLGINLLFDGLTNSTQDYIFQTYRPFSGPQMMCAQNALNTALTAAYLLASPYLATHTPLSSWLGIDLGAGEFSEAMAFLGRNPGVTRDVLGFAACGAIGQVFIFYTLSSFSSLLLVTVTVTRKMLTMILSVIWFGHRLGGMQWVGVSLVFGGVGAEGWIQRREKAAKAKSAKAEGKKEL